MHNLAINRLPYTQHGRVHKPLVSNTPQALATDWRGLNSFRYFQLHG